MVPHQLTNTIGVHAETNILFTVNQNEKTGGTYLQQRRIACDKGTDRLSYLGGAWFWLGKSGQQFVLTCGRSSGLPLLCIHLQK